MVQSPKPILKRSSTDHSSHSSTHHASLPSHSHHLSSPSYHPHSYPHPHSAPGPGSHSAHMKHHHPHPPSVHFPPSPSQLARTFTAYSSSAYDRSPIVVAPNSCAMPERGCPGRTYFDEGKRSPTKSKGGRGICGARDYHPRALAFASASNTATSIGNSTGAPAPPATGNNASYLGVPALIPDLSSESDESDGFAGIGGAPYGPPVTFGVHGLAISSSSPYSSSSSSSASSYSSSSNGASGNSKNVAIYPSASPYSPTSPYSPSSSPYSASAPYAPSSSSYAPYGTSSSPSDDALTFLPYPPSPPSSHSTTTTTDGYDGYEHDDEGPGTKDKPARRRRSERERRHESSRDPDRIRSCPGGASGAVGGGGAGGDATGLGQVLVGFSAMSVNDGETTPKKRSSSRRRKVYESPQHAFGSGIVDDGCLGGF
ncbi:unnamed protein product [Cyclocybe aegerita]|uniref:Uncharacterized protein n=1 Tax=Cyclocybe aegerita TaxID=1973307 RepID=A0A8S0W9X1_CYCAE|nr:unnamed protein product [Cyclocybe aegerita]